MQRRKFIASIGSVAAGAAAVTGTGAFTSVEANRDVEIQTAGDADAFLSISKATEDGNVTPNAEEYVTISDGKVGFDFTSSDDTPGSASGVNKNAKTVFDNLIDIKNNGTQDIVLSVDSDLIASQGGFLGIYAENSQGDGGSDNTGLSNADSGQTTTLSPGDAATNIGIYIPSGNTDQVEGGTLVFIAERVGGNRD